MPTVPDVIFDLQVPTHCPDVPDGMLRSRTTWSDADAYDQQARALAAQLRKNFAQFEAEVAPEVRDAGPGRIS